MKNINLKMNKIIKSKLNFDGDKFSFKVCKNPLCKLENGNFCTFFDIKCQNADVIFEIAIQLLDQSLQVFKFKFLSSNFDIEYLEDRNLKNPSIL